MHYSQHTECTHHNAHSLHVFIHFTAHLIWSITDSQCIIVHCTNNISKRAISKLGLFLLFQAVAFELLFSSRILCVLNRLLLASEYAWNPFVVLVNKLVLYCFTLHSYSVSVFEAKTNSLIEYCTCTCSLYRQKQLWDKWNYSHCRAIASQARWIQL